MKKNLFIISLSTLVLIPTTVWGADYVPIVDLPLPIGSGVSGQPKSIEDFIRILYVLSISIAGLLAVVKIIYGGVQYMLSDVVTNKESAKKDIWGAIIGLLIVLSAVFILEVINPQLKELNVFHDAPGINHESSSSAPGSNGSFTAKYIKIVPPPDWGEAAAHTAEVNRLKKECLEAGNTPDVKSIIGIGTKLTCS